MKALLFLFLFLSNVAFAKTEIIVRRHTVIAQGARVVLADLIDVTDVTSSVRQRLAQIPLAAAPAPGEQIEFSSEAISSLLRSADIPADLHIQIPAKVVVERLAHVWSSSGVAKELVNFWQKSCADCQFDIDQISVPGGTFDSWRLQPKPEVPRGGFSVSAEVVKQGQPFTLWIQGHLTVRRLVPVAKRAIYFGERLQASDIGWESRDVTYAEDGIPTAQELAGKLLRSPVRVADILWSGLLVHEKALRRGDITRAYSGDGDWEISISAVAQQDADVGDTVLLRNPRTNKDLTGVVVAKGEVEIK